MDDREFLRLEHHAEQLIKRRERATTFRVIITISIFVLLIGSLALAGLLQSLENAQATRNLRSVVDDVVVTVNRLDEFLRGEELRDAQVLREITQSDRRELIAIATVLNYLIQLAEEAGLDVPLPPSIEELLEDRGGGNGGDDASGP